MHKPVDNHIMCFQIPNVFPNTKVCIVPKSLSYQSRDQKSITCPLRLRPMCVTQLWSRLVGVDNKSFSCDTETARLSHVLCHASGTAGHKSLPSSKGPVGSHM